jgi:hypothetical protein
MERWTIAEPSEGRFRPHINHGGTAFWCMLDFALLIVPESNPIEFALAVDADPISVEWFPHLRRGFLQGMEKDREHGREWIGVRVEVQKIHTHPIDTTEIGCERYGYLFVSALQHRGTQLQE